MADTARGQVSMTPIVTILADADSDSVDAIHHDIGGSVGGKLEYAAVSGDRWHYKADKNITTDQDLIGGNFTDAATAVNVSDIVKYISVTHTGKDVSGDATSVAVHIGLDGGTPKGQTNAFSIGKNESMIFKPAGNLTVANLQVATADDTSVVCKIVAIINDIG